MCVSVSFVSVFLCVAFRVPLRLFRVCVSSGLCAFFFRPFFVFLLSSFSSSLFLRLLRVRVSMLILSRVPPFDGHFLF